MTVSIQMCQPKCFLLQLHLQLKLIAVSLSIVTVMNVKAILAKGKTVKLMTVKVMAIMYGSETENSKDTLKET